MSWPFHTLGMHCKMLQEYGAAICRNKAYCRLFYQIDPGINQGL